MLFSKRQSQKSRTHNLLGLLPALLMCLPLTSQAATGVQFSSIITARSNGAIEASMVEGGSWLSIRNVVHQAIYIKHPKGNLLFDTGLGSKTQAALDKLSWLDRQLFAISDISSVATQLAAQGIAPESISAIIPSHLHWDHTGGLVDLAGIPVLSTQAGIDAAHQGATPAYLKEHLTDDINWQALALDNKSYLGFATSLDIYQDNSLVLVGLAGHTPGQVGLFLNTDAGKQYFFIGDTTWLIQGVDNNKARPNFTQWMVGVDADMEQNSQVIEKIHLLTKTKPELIIVPAHDPDVANSLPQFPVFSPVTTAAEQRFYRKAKSLLQHAQMIKSDMRDKPKQSIALYVAL